MRPQQDRIGGRWLGLLGVSTFVLLAGCGWFDGGSPSSVDARPGADRQVAPSSSLPPPSGGGQHEPGIAPAAANTPQIGSVVAGKGGQKAQKEAIEKEAIERDAKAREERDAARKAADEAPAMPPGGEPASGLPTQPSVPSPAPVNTTTMPPPASGGAPAPEPGQTPVPDKPS